MKFHLDEKFNYRNIELIDGTNFKRKNICWHLLVSYWKHRIPSSIQFGIFPKITTEIAPEILLKIPPIIISDIFQLSPKFSKKKNLCSSIDFYRTSSNIRVFWKIQSYIMNSSIQGSLQWVFQSFIQGCLLGNAKEFFQIVLDNVQNPWGISKEKSNLWWKLSVF